MHDHAAYNEQVNDFQEFTQIKNQECEKSKYSTFLWNELPTLLLA